MLFISILLLISVSINCEDSVVSPLDWCPIVKPNGTYKGLGIYHRFHSVKGEANFVMFNSAGDEWIFELGYNRSHEYGIEMLSHTLKRNTSEGVDYRFSIYCKESKFVSPVPEILVTYLDCTVRKEVKISYFLFFSIIKLLSIGGHWVQHCMQRLEQKLGHYQ